MAEYNLPNIYPNLNNQQQFRLNKISEVKDYVIGEIREGELIKSLIVLSATSGSIYIASFATVIGAPAGIVSAGFSLTFAMSAGIVKTWLKNSMK